MICADSPTCSKQSMRLIFVTAASNKWEIKSLDIKVAFSQGEKIERDVFSDHQVMFALKMRFGN